jgi:hypothetical protein
LRRFVNLVKVVRKVEDDLVCLGLYTSDVRQQSEKIKYRLFFFIVYEERTSPRPAVRSLFLLLHRVICLPSIVVTRKKWMTSGSCRRMTFAVNKTTGGWKNLGEVKGSHDARAIVR